MTPSDYAVTKLHELNRSVFGGLLTRRGYDLEQVCAALPDLTCTEISGNYLFRPAELGPGPKIVVAKGATGNILVDCRAQCGAKMIQLNGSGSAAVFEHTKKFNTHVNLGGDGSLLFVGRGATANDASIVVGAKGDASGVAIGQGSMLSFDITIRATDSHATFALDTGKVRRTSAPVTIAPLVWLGEGTLVLKGSRIGAGSIIGANAMVTGEIEATSLAVGMPARVVQRGVSWTRSPSPTERDMAQRKRELEQLGIDCSEFAGAQEAA